MAHALKKAATEPTGVSRSIGNALSGASAGAFVGGLGGVPGAIVGATIGAVANVVAGLHTHALSNNRLTLPKKQAQSRRKPAPERSP